MRQGGSKDRRPGLAPRRIGNDDLRLESQDGGRKVSEAKRLWVFWRLRGHSLVKNCERSRPAGGQMQAGNAMLALGHLISKTETGSAWFEHCSIQERPELAMRPHTDDKHENQKCRN